MTCWLVGAPNSMFSGLGARGLDFAGEMLLAAGAAPAARDASDTPASPSAPPAMPTGAAGCSRSESGGAGCRTPSDGPRRVRAGRELGKSFPSKQDPYLAAACVGRPGAEGLVPPPRGLARLQRGGTRVLPAERWGYPAAGWAHATQLCPQPSVRLSRNGGSLHGWGITSRADSYPRLWPNPGRRGAVGVAPGARGLPLHPEGEWCQRMVWLQLFNLLRLN